MRHIRSSALGALMAIALGLSPAITQAQQVGQPTILTHDVATGEVTPSGTSVPGLGVRLTFSVLESTGAIRKADVERADLKIGNDTYSNEAVKLQSEWSVVVLVDNSTTLGAKAADFQRVRDTLQQTLGGLPDGSFIALMTFADDAPMVQGFTKDKESIGKALVKLTAKTTGGSCLNEGVYTAIRQLGRASDRRAVFIVSASNDNCGRRSTEAVLTEARNNNVQLYAVGVEGYAVTRAQLDALATPTRGVVQMGGLSDLNFAITNGLAVLASQWQVAWTVFADKGPNKGDLTIRMKDGTSVKSSLSFDSPVKYARPTTVKIDGVVPSPSGVRINLSFINRDQIKQVDVNIISKQSGRPVSTQSFNIDNSTDSVLANANSLTKDGEFNAEVSARDETGKVVAKSEPFAFTNKIVVGSIDVPRPDFTPVDPTVMTVTVARKSLEGVSRYKFWLEPDGSATASIVNEKVLAFTGDQPYVVPIDTVPAGKYKVKVQPLDSTNAPIADAVEARDKLEFRRRTSTEKLVDDLRAQPIAIAGLALAVVLAVLGVMSVIGSMRNRSVAKVKSVDMALPEAVRRAPRPEAYRPEPMVEAPPPQPRVEPPRPEPQRPPTPMGAAAAGGMPAAVLALVDPKTLSYRADVTKSPFNVGRAPTNDGALPVDGTFGVSGQHMMLLFKDGAWHAQDDHSTNGTTVNNKVIPKGQPWKLNDGDVLGLGPRVRLQFRLRR